MSKKGEIICLSIKPKPEKIMFAAKKIATFRKQIKISQRELADRLQVSGLDIDKNAIQRIESGQRFVTDIELVKISQVLQKTYNELLD